NAEPQIYEVPIGEEKVFIGWTQSVARQFRFRSSKIGMADELIRLRNPDTAHAALYEILWCLVPEHITAKHTSPEALFLAVDHEAHGKDIWNAVIGVINDQSVSDEKKSSSKS
ncbi:MAG TPA: hypothetical protein V6D20_18385, partial [Candidatus Obscuribacterales bacterium]